MQGGHQLLNLNTNKIITRRNITRAVITKNIIQLVHAIATEGGMPRGINMSTSITGVNNEDRSNETYLHEVNDDEEETANDFAEQNHDEMEPDEMYETMNKNNIYERKESAEDIFENDEHEDSTVDTFEKDNAEDTFENNKHAEDEANNNVTQSRIET